MIALVRIALRRPYTFVVLALVILIIGPLAALRTPVDIFPDIRIPVVAIVWQYTGLAAGADGRPHHHAVPARADDDGQRHRAYRGDVLQRRSASSRCSSSPAPTSGSPTRRSRRFRRRSSSRCRPNTTPPLILNYNASTVPIIQLGAFRLGPVRAGARRPRPQHAAHAARHRSGRRHPAALWRQAAAGADRPRPRGRCRRAGFPARTSPTRSPRRT